MRHFVCNICATKCRTPETKLSREGSVCPVCNSNTRTRGLIAQLSRELFSCDLALPDFPKLKSVRGIGMSDPWPLAERLAEKFDYTNTFYHQAPKLDIVNPDPSDFGRYDFIVSLEIMEHVPPPPERAFENAAKLLKPNGILLMTVPHGIEGATQEHYPALHNFTMAEVGDKFVLINRTREGKLEVFENLVFHGGPGSTLEMRLFTAVDLRRMLLSAGFDSLELVYFGPAEFGADQAEAWSVPIVARKGRAQAPVGELALAYSDSMARTRRAEEELSAIKGDYEKFVAFHKSSHEAMSKDVADATARAENLNGQLETANRWALSLDEQLGRDRSARGKYERALWFRLGRRLFSAD